MQFFQILIISAVKTCKQCLHTASASGMCTYSQPSFSTSTWKKGAGVWMCKLGVISQKWLKIEVKLLLSANRKSYMPRRLAQQRMTLNQSINQS